MVSMKTHPHADATYRVVSISDGSFVVEVTVPDSHPTTVSSFPTVEAAETWIASKQQRVAAESEAGKWFNRPVGYRR